MISPLKRLCHLLESGHKQSEISFNQILLWDSLTLHGSISLFMQCAVVNYCGWRYLAWLKLGLRVTDSVTECCCLVCVQPVLAGFVYFWVLHKAKLVLVLPWCTYKLLLLWRYFTLEITLGSRWQFSSSFQVKSF